MSMYTQLLGAALGQHQPPLEGAAEPQALDEVHRCRRELEEGIPPDGDTDTVPVVLALQIAYDVALLELARVVGVDTDPSRFEQPQLERERLERAFGALGMRLDAVADGERSVSECT
jgi:hypothetical protein